MHIILGSDRSGFTLRQALEAHLKEQGHALTVLGPADAEQAVPYYDVALQAARLLQNDITKQSDGMSLCILVCGTGMGMSQVANLFKGVRAACVESVYAAKMARAVNDSNVLCMGGWFVAPELAIQMVEAFLNTGFTQGLEEWRGEWLRRAKERIAQLEEDVTK